MPLGHGQVDRLLARHGSHRPSYIRTPGPRYERAAVNELWHIDLKGRFDGTPFTDRGFATVPAFAGVADLLDAILAA